MTSISLGVLAGFMHETQRVTGLETEGSHGFVLEDGDDGDEFAISVRQRLLALSGCCVV